MKKISVLILVLALGLTIVACNNEADTINGNQEDLITLLSGETKNIDIDGDGKEEEVTYKINTLSEDEVYGNATITVGDASYETEGIAPLETLTIAKVDEKDSDYKILVGDMGPSSDYTTEFLTFDGSEIKSIGIVGGLLDMPLFDMNDGLKLNHDGTISTSERANIVQTWFYDVNYEIDDDKVKLVEKDFYPAEYNTKLLQDYGFYVKPSISADKVTLEKDTEVKFTETDNKEWTKMIYKDKFGDEHVAYLRVEDFFYVDGDEELTTQDLFDNLCFAD